MTRLSQQQLLAIYQRLFDHFGPQHWWPAESQLEMVLGAILTQNTNWNNVEKALNNLKQAGALSVARLATLPTEELQGLIRPSGFFRQKAVRIKLFIRHLNLYHHGELHSLLNQDLPRARSELLGLNGIGPETADSILLYAGEQPSFVIDAYTVRLLQRLGLIEQNPGYASLYQAFMAALPADAQLFNEFHALIVRICKSCCNKRSPRCPDCPLWTICLTGQTYPGGLSQ
jgi:endonuclease III related protein